MRGLASFHGGHSRYGDGEGTIEAIAAAAREKRFVSFGFTEHYDVPPQLTSGAWLRDRADDWLTTYAAEVRATGFLLGTEIEYVTGAGDWTREQIAAGPFDYVVGSVHYMRVDGEDHCIDCSRPRTEKALAGVGSAEALQLSYYQHVLELLRWRTATVIGHLDVIKIFLTPQESTPTPRIEAAVEAVLEELRDAGAAMDVNARGLIKPCAAIYPAPWILERARRIGVPVTLGDDSHGPEDVGLNLDRAVEAIRAAGYEHMWLVRDGALEPTMLPS